MTLCNLVLTPIVLIIHTVIEIVRTITRTVCGWVSSVITVVKTIVEEVCSWLPWPLDKLCDLVTKVIEVLETVWEWVCETLIDTIIDIVEGFFEYIFYILKWVCWIVDWVLFRWLDLLLCHLGVHGERCIRVCLKILTDREGNTSTTRERALEMIAESNELLRQCEVRLVVTSVEFIEKPDLMDNVPCGFGSLFHKAFAWFSRHACDCCSSMTIYYIRTIDGGARGCAIPFTSWILVAVDSIVDKATIVHEIGHQSALTHSSDKETVMATTSGTPPRTKITKGQCCMIRTASFTSSCMRDRPVSLVARPATVHPHAHGESEG